MTIIVFHLKFLKNMFHLSLSADKLLAGQSTLVSLVTPGILGAAFCTKQVFNKRLSEFVFPEAGKNAENLDSTNTSEFLP